MEATMTVKLFWCGKERDLSRVVLNKNLDARYAETIRLLAVLLGIPVTDFDATTRPYSGDLWMGCSPSMGWGESAGDTMWARSCEASVVVCRLASSAGSAEARAIADAAVKSELVRLGLRTN